MLDASLRPLLGCYHGSRLLRGYSGGARVSPPQPHCTSRPEARGERVMRKDVLLPKASSCPREFIASLLFLWRCSLFEPVGNTGEAAQHLRFVIGCVASRQLRAILGDSRHVAYEKTLLPPAHEHEMSHVPSLLAFSLSLSAFYIYGAPLPPPLLASLIFRFLLAHHVLLRIMLTAGKHTKLRTQPKRRQTETKKTNRKTKNVLIGNDGRAKIADFGVSQYFTDDEPRTPKSARSLARFVAGAPLRLSRHRPASPFPIEAQKGEPVCCWHWHPSLYL